MNSELGTWSYQLLSRRLRRSRLLAERKAFRTRMRPVYRWPSHRCSLMLRNRRESRINLMPRWPVNSRSARGGTRGGTRGESSCRLPNVGMRWSGRINSATIAAVLISPKETLVIVASNRTELGPYHLRVRHDVLEIKERVLVLYS